jgi:predicted cobalt transporter CbtA
MSEPVTLSDGEELASAALTWFRRRASAWAGRDAEESGDEVQPAPASAAGVAADNRESWPPQNRYDQTQTSGID